MRRFTNILINSVSFTLAWTGVAHADPITTAIFGATFAASFLGGVVSASIGIAVSFGLSLLATALSPASASSTATSGTQLSLQVGGNVPLSFLSGYSATAGSSIYPGVWGNSGATPNAYYVQTIAISDLPCALTAMWVNDQKITLPVMTGSPPTAQGWPITEFNDGADNLWVKFLDGSQSSYDTYLNGKFGSHPTRPFNTDMIGLGQAIVIVTALYNRNLFASMPTFFFESSGAKWYNPAKDSSVGGSGSHRWATPSTWEPSNNPVVQIYNIRRGVFYGSQWLFGGSNQTALDPSRLPVSNWIAGINACDALVTNADTSTEATYRAGGEITGDMQPVDVIDELLKSCNGRMSEIGGVYKIMVGAPGASVYSFTDADIVITDGQTYDPFPGLESTNNAIESTYPDPSLKWVTTDAPGLYNSGFEGEDGGRRLVASVQFPMVPYKLQVQRLNQALILDSRRFASHIITLPPDAWVLEPGIDVVAWTSTQNGYSAKSFLVTSITGQRGYNQVVALKEVNPSDYSWNAGTDQKATTGGVISTILPAAQVLTGWTASPADFVDGTGAARKPGIGVTWDSGQIDVRAVFVSAREKVSGNVEWSGEINYAAFPAGGTLPHAFLPNVTYQVQGDYIPYSGRPHTPSSWLDVTTNNVGNDATDILLAQLGQDTKDLLAWLGDGVREALTAIQQLALQGASQDFANYTDLQQMMTTLHSTTGDITASYENAILVATGPSSALVEDITALFVAMGGNSTGVNVRFSSSYTPAAGWDSRFGFEAFDTIGDAFNAVGLFGEVKNGDGRLLLVGSQIALEDDLGNIYALFNTSGEVINGVLRGPGTGNFWNLSGSTSTTGLGPGAFRVSNT